MTTLALFAPPVHSNPILLPFIAPDRPPFELGEREWAYDTAYTVYSEGGEMKCPAKWLHDDAASMGFGMGRVHGKRARARQVARELGYEMGREGLAVSEPPAGFDADEAAAWREGYRKGVAEYEAEVAEAAWIAEQEMHPSAYCPGTITDMDMWPVGCAS